MGFYYAELDENKICKAVGRLCSEQTKENMIRLEFADTDKIWRKYENGIWSAEKYEPQSTAPITQFEAVQAQLVEAQKAIAELALA